MSEFNKIFRDSGNLRNIVQAINHYAYDLRDLLENGPFSDDDEKDLKFVQDTRATELEYERLAERIRKAAIEEGLIL
ncbi:MAG: hypothetical protein ACI4TU_02205 [Candidatus Cryptobacteroides sp.]